MKRFLLLVCVCVLMAGCASSPAGRESGISGADSLIPPLPANWTWEGRTGEELRRTFGEPKHIVPHEGQDVWFFSKESQAMVSLSSEAEAKLGMIACGFATVGEEWRFFVKDGKVTRFLAARYVNGREIPFEKW